MKYDSILVGILDSIARGKDTLHESTCVARPANFDAGRE
jgi:hypothetical protein